MADERLLSFQKNEITEYHVYGKLADLFPENRRVLKRIAQDEKKHYLAWKKYTRQDVRPSRWKIFWYVLMARIFGLTFAVKLMEGGEKSAQESYLRVLKKMPSTEWIIRDEERHERELIAMIDEERVNHIGSMVLGVNDALVEITGTLAGLTFALRNSQLVGLAGMVTGIAATLSMAASEFLSARAEGDESAGTAALYTGAAYLLAVTMLVSPYFISGNPYVALAGTLASVVILISGFTFFISVVQEKSFRREFLTMFLISTGVAFLSFLVGLGARALLGVDV